MTVFSPAATPSPFDYRYALDAAMSVLAKAETPLVVCNAPELDSEVWQRVKATATNLPTSSGLWIEPLADSWEAELSRLARALAPGGSLTIVASRPLARLIPERRSWSGTPLGLRPGGLGRLRRGLERSGFSVSAAFGTHSAIAIALSLTGQLVDHFGRPDLGDRLHFAARLRYCTAGRLAALSTVALFFCQRA